MVETRPSTAGSEIAHDSNVNNWSSNSRPSSGSGSSSSNKVPLAALLPCRAETRPGSSQLSCFAEHSLASGAWGSAHYEGYYGPPTGLHNPCDRDLSYTGLCTAHHVNNRPVNPNVPDPKYSHSRPAEVGASDPADVCHPHDPRETSKFQRQLSDRRGRDDEQRWFQLPRMDSSNHEKAILSKAPIPDDSWGDDYKKDVDMHFGKSAPA